MGFGVVGLGFKDEGFRAKREKERERGFIGTRVSFVAFIGVYWV